MTRSARASGGVTTAYTWDHYNRLVNISADDASKNQTNTFGVNGFRRKKRDQSVETTEYAAGLATAVSNTTAETVTYLIGHQLMGFEKSGSFYWFLTDSLSTVRDIVNSSGSVVASYEFSEYGLRLTHNEDGASSQKTFVGGRSVQDEVAHTGLMLMGHRFYDPSLGRFLSRDPIGFSGGPNLHSYAGGQPNQHADAYGLDYGVGSIGSWIGDKAREVNEWLTVEPEKPYGPFQMSPTREYKAYDSGWWQNVETGEWIYFDESSSGRVEDCTMEILGFINPEIEMINSLSSGDPTGLIGFIPRLNWGFGSYSDLRKAGCNDAHHIVQDAAVRDLPGYSHGAAPNIQLPGPSNRIGTPHYKATIAQRRIVGGGTIKAELRIGYRALRVAGLTEQEARFQIERAAKYFFEDLGFAPDTVTRTVGNRRRR